MTSLRSSWQTMTGITPSLEISMWTALFVLALILWAVSLLARGLATSCLSLFCLALIAALVVGCASADPECISLQCIEAKGKREAAQEALHIACTVEYLNMRTMPVGNADLYLNTRAGLVKCPYSAYREARQQRRDAQIRKRQQQEEKWQ